MNFPIFRIFAAVALAGEMGFLICDDPRLQNLRLKASDAESQKKSAGCENCKEELYRTPISGEHGGVLVTALRAEPRTFNPLAALDATSQEFLGLIHADLIHINRQTLQTEQALANSWDISTDGLRYTLRLRPGCRFSDGHALDADDVTFTFRIHLDEKMHSPQRDLLVLGGKPISVSKLDSHTVQFSLPTPYGAAERIFDSIAILPEHKLAKAYASGDLSRTWGIDTDPREITGLGPFRVKRYVPGQRVVLERNPYYWKADRHGRRLPFLEEIVIVFIPTEDAQAIRFRSGELHLINTLSAENFLTLRNSAASGQFRLVDAGSSLEYNFLVFNMDDTLEKENAGARRRKTWFRQLQFRRAVSAAIDRQSIVRLVYRGLGDPLWGHVTEGNLMWVNRSLRKGTRSLFEARSLLKQSAFSWRENQLLDPEGNLVEFSILVSAANSQRMQIATIVQDDLKQLGMKVSIVSMEPRAMLDRVANRRDFDAALMGLASGDADPNAEMNVWITGGSLHLWNMKGAPAAWEQEIDKLMRLQMVTPAYSKRKALYDKVQQLVADNLPLICLASPHTLAGAHSQLKQFRPASLRPNTLWNADSLSLVKSPQ